MQILLKRFWGNKFLKGGVFYTASAFLINLINYLFNLIAGRSLGPQGYGELTTLFSYLSITTVPTIVFSNFIIQKIAGAPDNTILAKSLENLFWEKLRRLFVFIILLFLLAPLLSKLTNLSLFLSFCLILLVLLTIISSIYSSLLQGLQLFFLFSFLGVLGSSLKLSGALAVLLGLDGIYTLIGFIFASSFIGVYFSYRIFNQHIKSRFKKNQNYPKIEKRLIQLIKNRQFLLILFSTLALTIFNNADVIFVKKYFLPFEVGIYSAWSLFSKIILYSLGPFIALSFIFFSSGQKQLTERKTLHFSLFILLVVALISFIAYKYLTIPLIDIFFGKKFYAVAPFLFRASIFGTLYTGITFINNFFLAKKSRIPVILFISMFIYILLLLFIKKELLSIMNLNIIFSGILFMIYLVLSFKFF